MAENPIMILLREDPEFLADAVKELGAYKGEVHATSNKARHVIQSMAQSLNSYSTLTEKQASYARSLIETHFLGLLTELAQEVEEVRQEVVAEAKESEVHYASNARWGSF